MSERARDTGPAEERLQLLIDACKGLQNDRLRAFIDQGGIGKVMEQMAQAESREPASAPTGGPGWTAELPKVSGWYWVKEDGRSIVVAVRLEHKGEEVSACGDEICWPISEEKGSLWSGPLTPPATTGEKG